ncbi:hypothetical protein CKO50_22740 [Pseudoalteromonas sp. HM-SA03]|uniref:hypothetical protein n=1 Tax=Pseudoalteromonas sp. HM-SA03 TaxID=2029678 RepID=UPI000BAE05E0|nr:hypothetical protein [Pseudoalteromonas sp. HM-SA03]PAX99085.1 hypothetical protein CKO50_22740 [Pseudoalteromonas sp. HM-SA03]
MSCTVAAVCIAFVAVGVAIYAAAAVNAVAGLNVAAAISVAVSIAITVDGGEHDGNCNSCHSQGLLGRIEPKLMDKLTVVDTFSRHLSIPELHSKAVVDFKRSEARAVLNVVINVGLIELNEEQKSEALEALERLVLKSLGANSLEIKKEDEHYDF